MIIKNFSQLARTPLRRKALRILNAGLEAALIPNLFKHSVKKTGSILTIQGKKFDLAIYKRVFVIGGGKASSAMAYEMEKLLANHITAGAVNDVAKGNNKIIATTVAGHPLPNASGTRGVQHMLNLTSGLDEDDLVICLISGGGSSLLPSPPEGITLTDLKNANRLLVNSGAPIKEINTVRKHLSTIKGGQLAKHIYPATLITFILSDVVGDDLSSIASGPTVPDPTTYSDALAVLQQHQLTKQVPKSVLLHLMHGAKGKREETPKPRSKIFSHVHNFLIGTNTIPLNTMKQEAKKLGLNATLTSSKVAGEAADFGKRFLNSAKKGVTLAGGETVVTVKGSGKGGRCQEMCLNALSHLKEGMVMIACGSDGRDHTDMAGAIIDRSTLDRAHKKKLDIKKMIDNNDSYKFFKAVDDHINTGPTGTNVMDFYLVVRE